MRVGVLVGLLVLLAGTLVLASCSTASERVLGTGDDSETTAVIDPAVLEALEEQTEVEVYISLRRLDLPLSEQSTELRAQHASDVEESVLAVLDEDDFTLVYQYPITPALSGIITLSGVEKLSTNEFVRSVSLPGGGVGENERGRPD